MTSIIYGKLGIGKSVYCVKVGYQLFREMEYTKDEAYQAALDSMVFTPTQFGNKLKGTNGKQPIIILDDASFHIGSDLYQYNCRLHRAYKQALTTVRTKASSILFNCPHPQELAKFIRESDSYNIHIVTGEGGSSSGGYTNYNREAQIYGWRNRMTRAGPRKIHYRVGTDHFSCHLPVKWFRKMNEEREKYIDKPIEVLVEGDVDE